MGLKLAILCHSIPYSFYSYVWITVLWLFKELTIQWNQLELGVTEHDQMKNLVRGVEGWLLNGSAVLTSRRENEIKGIGQYMETSGWQMKNFVNFPRGLFYIKLHSPISESIQKSAFSRTSLVWSGPDKQ